MTTPTTTAGLGDSELRRWVFNEVGITGEGAWTEEFDRLARVLWDNGYNAGRYEAAAILAIEAEARAAALDEARAAVEAVPGMGAYVFEGVITRPEAIAAIDALRERSRLAEDADKTS